MDRTLISKLADFDRITGSQYFTNGVRELVEKYRPVSTKHEVDTILEEAIAQYNYSGVPEDEILALISRSPYSLKAIETTVQACTQTYFLLRGTYHDIVAKAEGLFRDIGVDVLFPMLSSGGHYIECIEPNEIPTDISLGALLTKVNKFADLCKLYQQFPYAFLRYRMENPDEQPLQKALVFLLSMIRRNSDATNQDFFASCLADAYAWIDAQISYKNQIYDDSGVNWFCPVRKKVSDDNKTES